jgi:hypothetical protein
MLVVAPRDSDGFVVGIECGCGTPRDSGFMDGINRNKKKEELGLPKAGWIGSPLDQSMW